jgi:hypothetical protein
MGTTINTEANMQRRISAGAALPKPFLKLMEVFWVEIRAPSPADIGLLVTYKIWCSSWSNLEVPKTAV